MSFSTPVTGCTNSMNVVVPITRKKGKVLVKATASTGGGGKASRDTDTIVVICTK